MREKTAVTFDRVPLGMLPVARISRFVAGDDGLLYHYTDERLRAIVPPEGFDAYVDGWPDCAPVVGELRGRPVVEQTVFIGDDAVRIQAEKATLPVIDLP